MTSGPQNALVPTVRARTYPWQGRVADRVLGWARALGAMPLTPEGIGRAAQRQTGLVDLRPDEVAEPLALICDDVATHPPSDLGKAMVYTTLVMAMASRRRLQHAPIPDRPKSPPIVLVGWFRTGTTLLQQLLGALPGYGWVPMHRLADPIARRGSHLRVSASLKWWQIIAPELGRLHPLTADGPEECWMLLMPHLVVEGVACHWTVPTYEAWLEKADRRPAYRTWARCVANLEKDLGTALVMKDPAHLRGMPAILDAVPDARLVWTHRDPLASVASFGSLTAVQHRAIYGRHDPERAGRQSLERMARAIEDGLAARAQIPAGRLADVPYAALVKDPVGCVERLCAELDLPFDRAAVQARADQFGKPKHDHRYDLGQWGLSEEAVQKRLPGYDSSWWTGEAPTLAARTS